MTTSLEQALLTAKLAEQTPLVVPRTYNLPGSPKRIENAYLIGAADIPSHPEGGVVVVDPGLINVNVGVAKVEKRDDGTHVHVGLGGKLETDRQKLPVVFGGILQDLVERKQLVTEYGLTVEVESRKGLEDAIVAALGKFATKRDIKLVPVHAEAKSNVVQLPEAA